ncbi:S8 family serine peptidase [Catenuloplanes sp. NPDC051500]|uniref:S8 family serine peptidase n=1 Tax=Catenuloplanes sp. NPDC051500 TaxID=3363959 RepID=UPI0037B11464
MAHHPAPRGLAALLLALALLLPAPAEGASEQRKYHVVATAADGSPETLSEIATALLGNPARAAELLALNSGRPQTDGGAMIDPNRLHPGWIIVLPWDAAGPGVEVGSLPEVPRGGATAAESCPGRGPDQVAPDSLPWAQLRFDLAAAWTHGRGAGATVAIVDTGVDGTAPALAGRVLSGRSSGNGGDPAVDCTGHGTAMAGIVAARAARTDGFSGMAPEAEILPVRVPVAENGRADPRDAAAAVRLAIGAGAGIVALTVPVDAASAEVTAAIDEAVAGGAAVVLPAGTSVPQSRPGLLRVGAAGADGAPDGTAPGDVVDVLAPGVGVTSLGTADRPAVQGSGADYAAAFAAGLLALVRAAAPRLSAAEAVQAVLDTTPGTDADPGFIDPAAAVRAAIITQPTPPPGDRSGGGPPLGQIALVIAGLALFLIVSQVPLYLVRRRRHR